MAKDACNSKTEQALRDATKVSPKKGEERPVYLGRLVTAILALDDASWQALGDANQDAANDLINAKKNGKPFPEFSDIESGKGESSEAPEPKAEEPEGSAKEKEGAEMATDKKKTSGGKKKPAKEKPAPKPKAAKKAGSGKERGGKIKQIFDLVLAKPNASVEDLLQKAKDKGIDVKKGTILSARGAYIAVGTHLQEKGKLKDEIFTKKKAAD